MKKQLQSIVIICVLSLFLLFSISTVIQAEELEYGAFGFGSIFRHTTGFKYLFKSLGLESNDVMVVNDSEDSDDLVVLQVGFKSSNSNFSNFTGNSVSPYALEEEDDDVAPEVIGPALVYPNPFRQSTDDGGILGYELSKNMDVEIRIYDMMANCIFTRTFGWGVPGGQKGYNKVKFYKNSFQDEFQLSAGVYFYFIINKGKILAKGKMGVVP